MGVTSARLHTSGTYPTERASLIACASGMLSISELRFKNIGGISSAPGEALFFKESIATRTFSGVKSIDSSVLCVLV